MDETREKRQTSAISVNTGESATGALRRWLAERPTKTAAFLAQKAVVLLDPNCGTVVWPV
jgi:hypothetical protein